MPHSRSAAVSWTGPAPASRTLPRAVLPWSAGAATLFHGDLVHRALTGRAWGALRSRWQAAARAAAPGATVRTVGSHGWTESSENTDSATILEKPEPVHIRGLLHDHGELGPLRWRRLLATHGTDAVLLRCPASPAYRGKLRELRVPGVELAQPLQNLGGRSLLGQALDLPGLLGHLGAPTAEPRLDLSAGGRGQDWSCRPESQLLMVLDGRLRVTLIAPALSALLDPLPAGDHWRAAPRTPAEAPQPAAPRWEAELEPGDVLVCPSWWWIRTVHRSRSLVQARASVPRSRAAASPLALAHRLVRGSVTAATAPTETVDSCEDSIRGHYARKGALHLREPRLQHQPRRRERS